MNILDCSDCVSLSTEAQGRAVVICNANLSSLSKLKQDFKKLFGNKIWPEQTFYLVWMFKSSVEDILICLFTRCFQTPEGCCYVIWSRYTMSPVWSWKIMSSGPYLTPRVSKNRLWIVLLTHFAYEKTKAGGCWVLPQGHRCKTLYQGHRSVAENPGRLRSWLSPFVTMAKRPPDHHQQAFWPQMRQKKAHPGSHPIAP